MGCPYEEWEVLSDKMCKEFECDEIENISGDKLKRQIEIIKKEIDRRRFRPYSDELDKLINEKNRLIALLQKFEEFDELNLKISKVAISAAAARAVLSKSGKITIENLQRLSKITNVSLSMMVRINQASKNYQDFYN